MRPTREIVLIYAVFAALWILLSDQAVEWLFREPTQIALANTLKGWFFVAITSLLLYGLLRRVTAGEKVGAGETAQVSRLPLALLLIAIAVLTGGGIAHTVSHNQEREFARLQAIADLKSRQIADWLQERQGDATFAQSSVFFAEQYRRWRSGDAAAGERLQTRLEQLRRAYSYAAATLLDPDGRQLWSDGNAPRRLAADLTAAVSQSSSDGRVRRVGPYLGVAGQVRLDFVAPLTAYGSHPPVIVLHVDVEDWLYPTLRNWPAPSASAETFLARRAGDDILYLNELRHRSDTAMKLRVPLTNLELLAAKAFRNEVAADEIITGRDYSAVPVQGVARAIAGTDWLMIAKLDQAELYAEAVRDSVWIGLAGLLALFVAGSGYYLLHQRSRLLFADRIRQSQDEKLRALHLLDAIAENSDDAIFAKDAEGRYMLFNRAAARFTGKTTQEVIGHDDHAIFPAEMAERTIATDREVITSDTPSRFEEDLPQPDGMLSVEVAKIPLHDEAGKVVGLFGIAHDISERKLAEEELRNRNAELERFNSASIGRELDMIELKRLINSLSRELGREAPFSLDFLDGKGT
jgi:PAS domain S-box-containing protein